MSYELYIDVRHHPRHNDEDELTESTAYRLADTDGSLTRAFAAGDVPTLRRAVAHALRGFADDLEANARAGSVEREGEAAREQARQKWLENRGQSR